MKENNLTQQIGIRFYENDMEKIQKKARKERVNLSAYVRKVVSLSLDED